MECRENGIRGSWEGGQKPENIGIRGPHAEVWSLSKVQWKTFGGILNFGLG